MERLGIGTGSGNWCNFIIISKVKEIERECKKMKKEKLLGTVRDQLLQNEMRIRIHGILGIVQNFFL